MFKVLLIFTSASYFDINYVRVNLKKKQTRIQGKSESSKIIGF